MAGSKNSYVLQSVENGRWRHIGWEGCMLEIQNKELIAALRVYGLVQEVHVE